MQIPFHLALLPTLIIASFPVAAADTQDNGEHYTATLPTVSVVGQSDTSVLKGYINYDEAAVTRNGQLIKETPQTVDTLNIQKNKNYGTNDLSSILEGNAGIDAAYDMRGESIFLRGFQADASDIYRDGVRESGQVRRSTANIERVEIDVNDVACFIIEPVQGEGGFLALDIAFAQALRRFCDEKNILLIVDEIQSGFGRTGQRFAFSRLGITPDLILLGKSIAGGVPLGAVVGRKALLDNLPKGGLGGTYSGNPIACAAALATLEVMTDAQLQAWGARQEEAILRRYETWRAQRLSPYLGRLTGVGAMRGIELAHADGTPAPQQLSQLLSLARDAGLLLMPSGKSRHIVRLLAPLTIEPEVLEEGLDILQACLEELHE